MTTNLGFIGICKMGLPMALRLIDHGYALASGPKALFHETYPILGVIGKNIVHVGEQPGLGQVMKLVNNFLSAVNLAASSEAFVLGVKAGLNPELMLKVVNTSTGRNTTTEDRFPKYILPRTFDYGFKMDLMCKDLKLCLEEADRLGVPMWIGNTVRQLWAYAVSQGGGAQDVTSLIRYLETWAES